MNGQRGHQHNRAAVLGVPICFFLECALALYPSAYNTIWMMCSDACDSLVRVEDCWSG